MLMHINLFLCIEQFEKINQIVDDPLGNLCTLTLFL